MNKIHALMTGVGIGAALVYLFYSAKKKPRGEPARHEATHLVGNAENVINVSSLSLRDQSCMISVEALPSHATLHGSATEAIISDTFAKPGRTGLLEEVNLVPAEVALTICAADRERQLESHKPADNTLDAQSIGSSTSGRFEMLRATPVTVCHSILSSCRWCFRKAKSIYGNIPQGSLARKLLWGIFKAGGLAYRVIRRVSFRVCLCTVGLRILVRISANKMVRRPAGVNRKSFSNKEWGLVIGCTALAFLIRLPNLRLQQGLTQDGVYYATLGKHLASGNLKEGISTFWSPLYPLLVGFSSLIFRDVETGGKFISAAAGGVLVIPVYLLARALYGQDVASIGAFLIAIHPTLINYSTLLLTESTYTLLFTIVLFAGLTALSGGGLMAFFSVGGALGACYLTKPEAIGYMGLMLVLALCTEIFGNDLPLSELLFDVLGLISGFSLLSLPYILFLRRATGRWTISDKFRAHVHSTESWERKWFGLPEGWLTTLADKLYAGGYREGDLSGEQEPIRIDRQSLRKMAGRRFEALKLEIQLATSQVIAPHFMLLIGFGLFQTEWAKEIYLLLFLSSTLIGYALCPDDITDRLLVPLIPLLLCWVAKGIVEVEKWLARLLAQMKISKALSFNNPALIRALILTALFFSARHSININLMSVPPNYLLEYRLAGEWIRGRSETPPLIMAHHPYTAFYAGGKPLYVPVAEYGTIIEHAKRQKIDYLVIDEGTVLKGIWGNNEYSNLRFLLDEQSHHPELELVYKFDGMPDRKLLIFTLT
jgi:Dolichyl-phosphate-mannose-protein mannosyltransferase